MGFYAWLGMGAAKEIAHTRYEKGQFKRL